jgi:hypothetical protein
MEEMRLPSNMGFHSDAPNSGAPVSFGRRALERQRRFCCGNPDCGIICPWITKRSLQLNLVNAAESLASGEHG